MKQLNEKSFTIDVELSEKHPDIVQIMLEHLYNEGSLHYDDVSLSDREVVSEKYYKGLTYGSISSEALAKKAAVEEDGYQLEYIFTITEKQRDPFIDCYGSRPDEYCILEDVRYALKLKFSFTRLVDVPEESVPAPVSTDSKERVGQSIPWMSNSKCHKRKRMMTKIPAPY